MDPRAVRAELNQVPSARAGAIGRARARARVSDWAMLMVSVALAVGATELGLRRFLPVSEFAYELDERWLFQFRAGVRKTYRHPLQDGGASVLVAINADGNRGACSPTRTTRTSPSEPPPRRPS